jgi:hypothetical protein
VWTLVDKKKEKTAASSKKLMDGYGYMWNAMETWWR